MYFGNNNEIFWFSYFLGVIQLINKKNGVCFTPHDETLFKTFTVYCGLALQYSKVHNNMKYSVSQLFRLEELSTFLYSMKLKYNT